MDRRIVAAIGVALVFAAGAVGAGEEKLSRGAEILAPFKRDLQTALRQGLAEGPAQAIDACRIEAPKIAAALSTDGVRVGRTSHRLRNPANVAPEWVAPILESYVAEPLSRKPRVHDLGGGRTGYVEPILTQALCLTCHGETLAPDVRSRIEAAYPKDQAIGFEVGDLRGVFWTEFPEVR